MINIFITDKGEVPNTINFSTKSQCDAEMSIQDLHNILELCKNDYENGMCISGGDPLLHSNFQNILSTIKDNDLLQSINFNIASLHLPVFINEFIDLSLNKDFISICLYYNNNELSQDFINAVKCLQEKKIKVEIGVEVQNNDNQNFESIISFAEKLGIVSLRWEITILKNNQEPSIFYESVKKNLISLLKLCVEKKITPYTTCNHIPYFFFSSEELRLLSYISNDNFGGQQCKNYLCFYPDNSVSGCAANFENNLMSNNNDFMKIRENINEKLIY